MPFHKITVIVPVYNVASFIEKCAISLFEQTIDDIEILFIDDCSPDNSAEILANTLQAYPSRQPHTRIIKRVHNGGLATVRKQGILEATGEYIIFCDGDDWVDKDLYECLYRKASEEDADIVACGLMDEYPGKSIIREYRLPDVNGKILIKNWYKECFHMSTCNKLVRRSIYTQHSILPWEGLNMWEDNALIPRVLYYANIITFVDGVFYHYNRDNMGAMSSTYGIKQVEQMISVAQRLTQFFKDKPDAAEFDKTAMAFRFLARINLITDSFTYLRKYYNTFKGSEKIIPLLDTNAFSIRGKIRFKMVQYHLSWLFVLLYKIGKNVTMSR